ncbi:MAG: tyrosine--tRNA ligase, partial [Hyphomicrobiaceae bacterium]
EDADVGRFLRLFTTLALDEIGRIEQLEGAELNEGKKILANEATAMVHGREAALKAGETARQTFEQGTMAQGLPTIEVARSELEAGLGLLDAFVRAGLASSNGEARRHIRGGGARVNDKPISNEQAELSLRDLGAGNVIKLSIGKKRHALVKCVSR